jgi:hypothetical protein
MRIGVFFPTEEHAPLDETVSRMVEIAEGGFSACGCHRARGSTR